MTRDRSQGILSFIGLVVICSALGYGAWRKLTKPKSREPAPAARVVHTGPDSVGFVSVAGEGVELEVVAPGGVRTTTAGAEGQAKIARSDASVDCPGFAGPRGQNAVCTASINLNTPAPGDYTVVTRSVGGRAVILNVGWATASQARKGAFDVRVQVAPRGATSFVIIVSREGVSQRSEPRAGAP